MDFVDNQLDPGTGTMHRAARSCPNPDALLDARPVRAPAAARHARSYRALLDPRRGDRRPTRRSKLRLRGRRPEHGAVPHRSRSGRCYDGLRIVRERPRRATTASSSAACSAPGPASRSSAEERAPMAPRRAAGRRAADAGGDPAARRLEPPRREHLALLHRPADLRGGALDRHRDRSAAVALPSLPVAQYPEVAPPTIVVRAIYPGAPRRGRRRHRRRRRSSRRSTASRTCSTCRRSRTNDGTYDAHHHVQARHRPRQGAGAGAEPRRDRRAAPARGGAAASA